MSKRITNERVKKWGIRIGITGVPLGVLLIWFLVSLGSIDIIDYSGDIICIGTELDPCIAYINFTVKENIFIYPSDNWDSTLFYTDIQPKSVKMYRSWGEGWREIKLNETCKGTWCGGGRTGAKYSFAFRKNKDYQIKYEVIKERPSDNIKWGFAKIDPIFLGINKENLIKEYNKDNQQIFIRNKLNKEEIMSIILISTQIQRVIMGENRVVAEIKIENKLGEFPINELIQSLEIYDLNNNGELINKSWHIEYREKIKIKEDKYKVQCNFIKIENNSNMEKCIKVKDGFKYNYKYIKKENLSYLPLGNTTLLLVTDVKANEHMEWIIKIVDIRIPEWAQWVESFNINLSSYYTLNESSGDAIDSVNNINGTLTGGVIQGVGGIISTSYDFDGINGWLNFSNVHNLGGSNFSISAWVNVSQGTYAGFWGKEIGTTSWDGWGLQVLANNKLRWCLDGCSGVNAQITTQILNAGWNHVVVTVQEPDIAVKIYINGTEADYDTTFSGWGVLTLNSHKFQIGSALRGDNDFSDGYIDEVAIWNRTITTSEISDLWNDGNGITYVAEFAADINLSVGLPNNIIRFNNCSPDWEESDSRPQGQTAVIAAINATNNGTSTGTFSINLTGTTNTGWIIFASNDSLVNNLTLSTTSQTIWTDVSVGETKRIWLTANCSFISVNPGVSIDMQVT